MLTVLDVASVAGDRAKQNDDATGATGPWAWVIDGATDLYAPPQMPAASDAAWIAHNLNGLLYAHAETHVDGARLIESAARVLQDRFRPRSDMPEGWGRPAASLILAHETMEGAIVWDLGDSRAYALDAAGAAHGVGGPEESAARETAQVRALVGESAEKPLDRADVIEALREKHAMRNRAGGWWVFAADPACAAHARRHILQLKRPAHLLLCTDGFSALADRYEAYDAAGLVRAALERGVATLCAELRAIEEADGGGRQHPRFKKSDDATALLVRLE